MASPIPNPKRECLLIYQNIVFTTTKMYIFKNLILKKEEVILWQFGNFLFELFLHQFLKISVLQTLI